MSQQAPPSQPLESSYLEKHKKPIIVSVAIITLIVILIAPIIPISYTATETRTRKLRYNSKVYSLYNVPKIVNVTNTDSIGGSFSVTMNKWYNLPYPYKPDPSNPFNKITKELEDTFTQSLFINADSTQTFYLPKDWIILGLMYSFTYSVSAPTTQETYNVTKTEYKSILALIGSS